MSFSVARSMLAALAFGLLSLPAAADDLSDAVAAYEAEDYATALPAFQSLAAAGDDDAMWYLGRMYDFGRGVEQSDQEAFNWYKKSADAGDRDAMWDLGVMYETGQGLKADETQAFGWYLKAAEEGHLRAMAEVGRRYKNGEGVRTSERKSFEWYERGAEGGGALAQAYLGLAYENGTGVSQSYENAAYWYAEAAEQGNDDGQAWLGELYETGNGVQRDLNKARELYELAAAQDNEYAADRLAGLSSGSSSGSGGASGSPSSGVDVANIDADSIMRTGDGAWIIIAELVKQGDLERAFELAMINSERNDHAQSQALVGSFHEEGMGRAQDFAEAARWYRMSAEKGYAMGQFNLGALLINGPPGVEANPDEAVEWFKKAAAQGNQAAVEVLQDLGVQ